MKSSNSVKLDGLIEGDEFTSVGNDSCMRANIINNIDAEGGKHPVDIYGGEAEKMFAYILACRQYGVIPEVTIFGWIFSLNGNSRLMANKVQIHTTKFIRRRTAKILEGIREGKFPNPFQSEYIEYKPKKKKPL